MKCVVQPEYVQGPRVNWQIDQLAFNVASHVAPTQHWDQARFVPFMFCGVLTPHWISKLTGKQCIVRLLFFTSVVFNSFLHCNHPLTDVKWHVLGCISISILIVFFVPSMLRKELWTQRIWLWPGSWRSGACLMMITLKTRHFWLWKPLCYVVFLKAGGGP